jgi:GTP-binding protein Era
MSDDLANESKFTKARDSLQETLGKLRGCSDRERQELQREFAQLNDMLSKLDHGQVELVVFGEISTGKSALINALLGDAVADVDVQGGWTREIQRSEWKTCEYRVPGLNRSGVLLVDTPGINEVEGQERAELAEEAARRADLILFVTDSDLNEVEHAALKQLSALKKPLMLVLNKKDLYSPEQRSRLLEVLTRERLPGLMPLDHVVMTSADPREVEYVIEDAQGNTRHEWRRPEPDIQDLKAKILEILDRDGLALVALNAAMYAADQSDRIAALRIELRNHLANRVIGGYAAVKALVVGWSPAAVDIIGGGLVDASMVGVLSKIYGLDLSWQHARKLAGAIGQAAGWVILGETVSYLGASLFKGLTLGLATPLTAIPQGAASGFASYIVGQSAKYYFEHGASWGGRSPKAVVQEILEQTDRESVLGHLKDEIKQKILFNPHARKSS